MAETEDDPVNVWLVERTYSDDEQNLIILTYATIDGSEYLRKERALTSFEDARETTAGLSVEPDRLSHVNDSELKEQYAAEATRMAQRHEPSDAI